jgi:hypothetical protein
LVCSFTFPLALGIRTENYDRSSKGGVSRTLGQDLRTNVESFLSTYKRERGDWLIETAKEWVEGVREDLLSEKGRE